MIYPVKVMDGYGNVKKIIQADSLKSEYWNKFEEMEKKTKFANICRGNFTEWAKHNLEKEEKTIDNN